MNIELKKSIPKRILVCSLGSIGRRHVQVINDNFPLIKIGVVRSGHGEFPKETNLIDFSFADFDSAIA